MPGAVRDRHPAQLLAEDAELLHVPAQCLEHIEAVIDEIRVLCFADVGAISANAVHSASRASALGGAAARTVLPLILSFAEEIPPEPETRNLPTRTSFGFPAAAGVYAFRIAENDPQPKPPKDQLPRTGRDR
jgi:hypothetical protein